MSTLEIDPPRQSLRLVSSHGERVPRDSRYRQAAELGAVSRYVHREVLEHGLRTGQAIHADALRVVLAVKQATDAGPVERLTAAGIWQLLFVDILAWCRNRRLSTPAGVNSAVECLIDYLDTIDGFAVGSDPAHALLAAIDECTGGWQGNDPEPQRSTRRSRSVRSGRGQENQ